MYHLHIGGGPSCEFETIFTVVSWYLSVKYDENQLRAVPDMPYHTE